MSKPVHITEKLIFGAADRLLNNGVPIVEITNNMIRKEIGGTGSFANIQPLLREWKQKQVASRGESIEMPDSFKETVSNFSAQLWKLAAIATEEKYISNTRTIIVSSEILMMLAKRLMKWIKSYRIQKTRYLNYINIFSN